MKPTGIQIGSNPERKLVAIKFVEIYEGHDLVIEMSPDLAEALIQDLKEHITRVRGGVRNGNHAN